MLNAERLKPKAKRGTLMNIQSVQRLAFSVQL